MISSLNFPTKRHKNFVLFLYEYCCDNNIGLALKGSIAKGNAKPFSDIDFVIWGNVSDSNFDEIIGGFEIPLNTFLTENPKGIFMVVYEKGLCIDFDIRSTFSVNEVTSMFVVNKIELPISSEPTRKLLNTPFLKFSTQDTQKLRLLYRSVIKFLNNKVVEALELLNEFYGSDVLKNDQANNYPNQIRKAFKESISKNHLDSKTIEDVNWLMARIDEKSIYI